MSAQRPEPLNIWDYERLFEETLDAGAYGYFTGGADDEITLRDNDGSSASNNSGITLVRPNGGWKTTLFETEYLCFYDVNSWPVDQRAASNPPPGCFASTVPINTASPSINGTPHRRQ